MLKRYYEHISLLKEKYADKIKLLCGIEIATDTKNPHCLLPDGEDVSYFDYCLIEHLNPDTSRTVTKGDLFGYAERLGTKTVGIAHTDMFAFIRSIGEEPNRYFRKMAENGIFWEINVNYDSLHSFKTHDYVTEFFKNKEQQAIVKRSGVKLSVGFDGHIAKEYKGQKVKTANALIKAMGIPLAFESR
jgi:histidinol phosphatase-like PHP family hydrolase